MASLYFLVDAVQVEAAKFGAEVSIRQVASFRRGDRVFWTIRVRAFDGPNLTCTVPEVFVDWLKDTRPELEFTYDVPKGGYKRKTKEPAWQIRLIFPEDRTRNA